VLISPLGKTPRDYLTSDLIGQKHNRFHTSVNFPVLFWTTIYKHSLYTNLCFTELASSSVNENEFCFFFISPQKSRRGLISLNSCLFHQHWSFWITFIFEPNFAYLLITKLFIGHTCVLKIVPYISIPELYHGLTSLQYGMKPEQGFFDRTKFQRE